VTVAEAWAAPYIGLPYADKGRGPAAWDCWGGVRMVFAEVFGLHLPDYLDAYTRADDHTSVAAAITAGLADGWHRVARPVAGDLLILKIAQRPWHSGVLVSESQFLHWPPPGHDGRQTFSCLERLDSPHYARRIEGMYHHG
jgi:cell wall-associated NlpC family hydrolase